MPAPLDCPGIECWQALFGDALPPDQREHCERHLESCPICQDRLDHAEECRDALRRLGRQVGDPTLTPVDPTLTHALEQLREGTCTNRPPVGDPGDLYFLRPTDRLDVLGMLGDYEVLEVIGQGGMGVVLKAYEPALNRLVAIKVLAAGVAGSAVARKRFAREAQAAAAVCHEHIVAVHRVHEEDGLPYLVMQYVAGESLQDRLDRSGPLEVEEVVRIGMQTAQGLAAAHAQGLIHRDIKPANLLLSFSRDAESSERSATTPPALRSEDSASRLNKFEVKITDFGLARMVDDVGLTQNGVVAGTPEYMAPEQARGESVDYRADLFSLGSVLYAMCTGMPPFQGSTAVAVLRQVSDEVPPPIRALNPDAPQWLEAFIARLMAKSPADRLQTAAETADLLTGYLAHLRQPITVPAPALPATRFPDGSSVSRPLRRLPRLLALALGMVLVVAAVLLKGFLGQAAPVPAPAAPAEFYQDFRAGNPLLALLLWTGKTGEEEIEQEDRGLRIRLPAQRKRKDPVGVVVSTPVKGDVEITTGYELLGKVPPRTGYGVGVDMYIVLETPAQDALAVARVTRPDGAEMYVCNRMTYRDGKRLIIPKFFPASGRSGRMRMTRQGGAVQLWAAEGAGEFRELIRYDMEPADLKMIRTAAYPGYAAEPVDVRIVDLRIRSASGFADQVADAAPAGGPPAERNGALTYAFLVLLAVLSLAAAWGVWFSVRHRRAEILARPASSPPAVSFPCSACGKTLKARPDLVGKKVKCTGCGKAVLVP